MGAYLSTALNTIALIVVGVMSVMAAINTQSSKKMTDDKRKSAHKMSSIAAAISFIMAALGILLAVFLA